MIEELNLLGVYAPAALVWAIAAVMLTWLARPLLYRLPLRRLVWQPALLEFALFAVAWWGIASLADAFLPAGIAHHR